jgi:hypothetical protein
MITVIREPGILEYTFTEKELENPLFTKALTRIRGKKDLKVSKKAETVTIRTDKDVGVVVDEIREMFMGDVLGEEDTRKDLANCPLFTFTPTRRAEPEDTGLKELEPERRG